MNLWFEDARVLQPRGDLNGPGLGVFSECLRKAFLPPRFRELLLYRLDRSWETYTAENDDYPAAMSKVLRAANAELWWRDLLREARNAAPVDPQLAAFAEQIGQAPQVVTRDSTGVLVPSSGRELELRIKSSNFSFDVVALRKRVAEIENCICRVEYPEKTARGTGCLVGPDLVLTNYHVVKDVISGKIAPSTVRLRFDYKVLADELTVSTGQAYELAADWLVDQSPNSATDFEAESSSQPATDELDYALLRVSGTPGSDPIGGPTNDPKWEARRWLLPPSTPYDFSAHRALCVVQHPDGLPMRIVIDSEAVLGLNANATRVRYTTETQPGSSGSPCFGADLQWVALHHSGDPRFWKEGKRPTYNQGIPLSSILELLKQRGKAGLLGARW